MSRVITFSRVFPKYHPKAGEPTYFIEKIWQQLKTDNFRDGEYTIYSNHPRLMKDGHWQLPITWRDQKFNPKYHTIRNGNRRWKVGDKFSPRVWSGKPYASKQITIAPDIEVKKVWNIEILFETNQIHIGIPNGENQWLLLSAGDVAKNDGLSVHDFYNWFDTPKNRKQKIVKAQIICWNKNIKYADT